MKIGLENKVMRKNTLFKAAWGEAHATAWLADNGYEVYLGFGNTSADMVAIRDNEILRVEVKVGSPSGKKFVVAGVKPDLFDMLLVVLPDGSVVANPDCSLVTTGIHAETCSCTGPTGTRRGIRVA